MPSVRIIYDVEGWAFHHQAIALRKHAPADVAISFGILPGMNGRSTDARLEDELAHALGDEAPDIVLLLTATRLASVREALHRRGWPTRLVGEWSDGVPRRLDVFRELYANADAWVINNQSYWEASGRLPGTHMIANGIDPEVFRITRPPAARKAKVLWVGSQLHRQLKGYDDFIVPLCERLSAAGIDSEARLVDSYGSAKLTPTQMADWYNHGTVLVCASESEGTPNPALEAAACGCTVVSTRVGNMPQLIEHGVNGYLVERDLEAITAATLAACADYPRLAGAMQETIADWHWAPRAAEFFDLFRTLLANRKSPDSDLSRRDPPKDVILSSF